MTKQTIQTDPTPMASRTGALLTWTVSLSLVALSCGGNAGPGHPDAGHDADPSPDSGAIDETPVTDRPSRGLYTCRIARDRTDYSPRQWRGSQGLFPASAGAAFMARLESTPPQPFDASPTKLVVSTLDLDGVLGAPWPDPGAFAAAPGHLATAPRADGVALTWLEGSALRFAAYTGNGQVAIAARDLPVGIIDDLAPITLAAGANGGFGLLYTAHPSATVRQLRLLSLDAGGQPTGTARSITDVPLTSYGMTAALTAAPDGGYALIWSDPNATPARMLFATVDATGATLSTPRPISLTDDDGTDVGGSFGFASSPSHILGLGDSYLATWGESRQGSLLDGSGAWTVVRLARLDRSGAPLGVPVLLRAPTDSVDEVEPLLARFGNAVAVTWARGYHIYVCAGCIPNHRIDLMLIDPVDLVPISNVVTLTNGGGQNIGGLLRRQAVVLGSSVLVTYNLTFHVHATAGSATFVCDKNP
jgi:hypothetical protein